MNKYQVLPIVYLKGNWYFDSVVDILIIKHTFYWECSTLSICFGFRLENYTNKLIWMASLLWNKIRGLHYIIGTMLSIK